MNHTITAAPPPEPVDATAELLRLDEIVVRFGGIRALNGVSCSVGRGEIVGVIGPNGAGKTTLFDVIAGVRRPNSGTVHLAGRDVTEASAVARSRAGLRRTFQRVQTFGWLSVEDNVLAALEWRGGGGGFVADTLGWVGRRRRQRARRQAVDEVLERCGLTSVRTELAGSLPIGIARMVELARAVVDRPRLVLLDEPASGLDAAEHHRLGELIQATREATGCGVLLVEHDAGFVVEQCDRIVVLDQGAVLEHGTPAQILASQAVRAAYLGETTSGA